MIPRRIPSSPFLLNTNARWCRPGAPHSGGISSLTPEAEKPTLCGATRGGVSKQGGQGDVLIPFPPPEPPVPPIASEVPPYPPPYALELLNDVPNNTVSDPEELDPPAPIVTPIA